MDIEMSINGHDIREWGLTPLKGTLASLMQPANMKALTYNDSRAIHGSRALLVNRRVSKRDLSLLFHIHTLSDIDLARRIDQLVEILINGKSNSGENEVFVPRFNRTYKLVFTGFDSYAGMKEGRATIGITFTELNPTDR
ncbi:MAG: hypothetical protein IJP79_07220 [Paludibacteraceae bacterium]|nr:hypothetical protein [Paludibacteraceae bacterium]MBQ6963474.1 hypothetical protein [Paludibacteraceae bacterium]MBQ7662512.1 hypothetical protein [Prevotella sp.]MBQ7748263.1 hypothetical protein [Paludibacteraceae bacterium]